MLLRDILATLLIGGGVFYFLTGLLALLRLPDAVTRVHALTKVDTLGMGLVILGLMLWAPSWTVAAKLALCWFLVLVSGSTACYLVVHFLVPPDES